MKKVLTSVLIWMAFMSTMNAQVVINEIMYNSPGEDSLEYIELYNPTTTYANVSQWTMSGIEYTFPEGTGIAPGVYVVLAANSGAMMNVYGVTATQWQSGGVGNGGETISLLNASGDVVDEVTYDDRDDWPTSPDGNGPSLSLCDPMEDNSMARYWSPSNNSTGVMVEGVEIGGTPGAANGIACPVAEATVQVTSNVFTPSNVTIYVGQTVEWVCTQGNHNVNGMQTTFSDNPESFGNAVGGNWTYSYTFNTAGVYNYQCDPHVGLGMTGTVTVLEEENNNVYPMISIEEAAAINPEGIAVLRDSLREVQGVVYGVNMNGNGLSFTIIDENNIEHGMGVYSNSETFGYTVMEGDKVSIKGTVGQFNGLTQIAPDEITVLSSGNTIFEPVVTTTLGEAEESKLIRIENVMIADAPSSGLGNYTITDGENTYIMRIDGDTGLGDFDYPDMFHVVGIGGQYDNSEPYLDGYQFFPRSAADIIPVGDVEVPDPITYPAMNIADVTTVNENGVVDSLEVTCMLEGIVYGVDLNTSTNLFTIIDENDMSAGIAVYNSQDSVSYEVMEGDKVRIKGEIGQYNGLQQIVVADIEVVSQGNTLHSPMEVISLGETEESSLVVLKNLRYVSHAQAGGGFNCTMIDENDSEFLVRLDNETGIALEIILASESTPHDIVGIGGQYDNSDPYTEGYQLLPRTEMDIMLSLNTNNAALGKDIQISPNPVAEVLNIATELAVEEVIINNNLGQEVTRLGAVNNIHVANYPKGIYYITFVVNSQTWTTKFVKH